MRSLAGSVSGSKGTHSRPPRIDDLCGKERDHDNELAAHSAARVEGPPGPLQRNPRTPPPPVVRRRPNAWRAIHGRGRGYLPGLLEEPRHARDAEAARRTGRTV